MHSKTRRVLHCCTIEQPNISSSNTPLQTRTAGLKIPEAAAASSEPGEAEVVAVAPPTAAVVGHQQSQQNQQLAEKLQRVNHELRSISLCLLSIRSVSFRCLFDGASGWGRPFLLTYLVTSYMR